MKGSPLPTGPLLLALTAFVALSLPAHAAGFLQTDWREGVGRTSVGRFGKYGWRATIPEAGPGVTPMVEYDRRAIEYPFGADEPDLEGDVRERFGEGHWLSTCQASWADMRFGSPWYGGWPWGPYYLWRVTWVPEGYRLVSKTWKVNWTTLDQRITLQSEAGTVRMSVVASTVSPGILLRVDSPFAVLRPSDFPTVGKTEAEAFFHALAVPLKGRPQIATLDRDQEWAAPQYRLNEPWLLLWQGGNPEQPESLPLLVVFEKRPDRIRIERSRRGGAPSQPGGAPSQPAPCLKIEREGGVGRLVLMPLYGTRCSQDFDHRFGYDWASTFHERLRKVRGSSPPPALSPKALATIRQWTEVLQCFPVKCREMYRVDERAGWVEVRDEFQLERLESDFPVPAAPLAPVPPTLALAQRCGYPVQWLDRVRPLPANTFCGPFVARVGSAEVAYRLPLPPAGELPAVQVVAPPLVKEDLEKVNAELALAAGRLNASLAQQGIGGDWDACGAGMGVARTALASPAVSDVAREVSAQTSSLRLRAYGCTPWKWAAYRDPNVGTEWSLHTAAEKHPKFEQEWAIGLFLNGVAAYLATTGDWPSLEEQGEFIRRVGAFYRAVHDWAAMTYSTSGTGSFLKSEIDPFSAGYEGLCSLATISRLRGSEEDLADALYLTARCAVPSVLRLLYQTHQKEFWTGTCDLNWSHEADRAFPIGASAAGTPAITFNNWLWGLTFHFYSGMPDLFASFRRFAGPELRWIETDVLPRYYPEWFKGPYPQGLVNAPPLESPLHVLARASLGLEAAPDLIRHLQEMGGGSSPWVEAAALSSGAEAYPAVIDRYFVRCAVWDPGTRGLEVEVGGSLGDKVLVGARCRSRPPSAFVNSKAVPVNWDKGRQWAWVQATLPATVHFFLVKTPSVPERPEQEARLWSVPVNVTNEVLKSRPLLVDMEIRPPRGLCCDPFTGVAVLDEQQQPTEHQVYDVRYDKEGVESFHLAWWAAKPGRFVVRHESAVPTPSPLHPFTPSPLSRGHRVAAAVPKGWMREELEIKAGEETIARTHYLDSDMLVVTPFVRGHAFGGSDASGLVAQFMLIGRDFPQDWRINGRAYDFHACYFGPVLTELYSAVGDWWDHYAKALAATARVRVFGANGATILRFRWELTARKDIEALKDGRNGLALVLCFPGAAGTGEVEFVVSHASGVGNGTIVPDYKRAAVFAVDGEGRLLVAVPDEASSTRGDFDGHADWDLGAAEATLRYPWFDGRNLGKEEEFQLRASVILAAADHPLIRDAPSVEEAAARLASWLVNTQVEVGPSSPRIGGGARGGGHEVRPVENGRRAVPSALAPAEANGPTAVEIPGPAPRATGARPTDEGDRYHAIQITLSHARAVGVGG